MIDVFGTKRRAKARAARRAFEEQETQMQMRALDRQESFFAAYPLRYEFDYLGLRMRVTAHQYSRPSYCGVYAYIPAHKATLVCDYVDGSGRLRQAEILMTDLVEPDGGNV